MNALKPLLSRLNWQTYYEALKKTGKLDNPTCVRELFYLRGFQDYEFFVKTFFAHHCQRPFSKMHRDFFADEVNPDRRGRRDVVAAPRGHAKTTFKTLFKVLHAIVYEYECFIVIIGHSAPEAEAKVRDILEELETNTLLHAIYGPLAPMKGKYDGVGRWGGRDFITQNGIRVLAKSRGKQVRGLKHGPYRPSLIILDDAEAPDRVLNEEQRQKTRDWFTKDILKMGQIDGQTNIQVVGTCLHPESLLSELLASPGWAARKYQAVLSFAQNEDLWQVWRTLVTDLANPEREQVAQAFYRERQAAMLEGTSVLWPDGEPYEALMKMLISEGRASFQSEKQNDPYDPERQIFDMSLAKGFRYCYQDKDIVALEWLDGSGRVTPVSELERIVAFHDPALPSSKDSDYAAIVVCAVDRDGYFYCLEAYIEKVPPSRQIEQALMMHQRWGLDQLYLEDNNFQGVLKQNYRDLQEQHPDLRVIGVTQYHNKEKRISMLEPLITYGLLLFAEDISQRLWSQMILFPTGHDDGPDALHGAVEQLRKKLGRVWQIGGDTIPV